MKDNPKLNELHGSFACVLCGIMKSDGVVSENEREKFDDFFVKEFALDTVGIEALFQKHIEDSSYDEDIALLKVGFAGSAMTMARFMQYLNACILCDGEYTLFKEVRDGLV